MRVERIIKTVNCCPALIDINTVSVAIKEENRVSKAIKNTGCFFYNQIKKVICL